MNLNFPNFPTCITTHTNNAATVTLFHNNYNKKLGWFNNQPEWHECIIKFPNPWVSNDIKLMIWKWLDTKIDVRQDAIWYDTGKHFKIKFKDQQAYADFNERWAFDWAPADSGLCHHLKFAEPLASIMEIAESKVGPRGQDWEFCLSGIWFRRPTDLVKVRMLSQRKSDIKHLVRPLSKSFQYITEDGRKVEMFYRYNTEGLLGFGTGFLGLGGGKVTDLSGGSARAWCEHQYEPATWHFSSPWVYFEKETDLMLFILRWA